MVSLRLLLIIGIVVISVDFERMILGKPNFATLGLMIVGVGIFGFYIGMMRLRCWINIKEELESDLYDVEECRKGEGKYLHKF